jgi:hypothetical protein
MAVQMTRAEYQAKYGVAPVVSTSTLNIKPSPRRMTRAEYEAEYGKPKSLTPIADIIPGFSYNPEDTGLSNIPKAIANIPREVGRAVEATARVPGEIYKTVTDPSVQAHPLKAVQGFAETAYGTLVKPVVDVLSGMGNTFLGQIQKVVKDTTGYYLGDTRAKQALNEANPNLYKVVQAVQEMLVSNPLATAGPVVQPLKPVTAPIVSAAKTVRQSIIERTNVQTTAHIADEIYNIENNYSKLRTANDRAIDSGAASRQRIAQTDVLVDSVDSTGTIRTKQPNGAVDQYRALAIEGKEEVVRENLVNEGKKVNLAKVERDLVAEVGSSGLEGADLVKALQGIKNEIKGLKLRANEFGDVELAKIHDAKINTYKNIDYNSPIDKTYRKAVARTYKQVIEENSATNVKEVNTELAKYYQDIDRLERLDGRKTKGGKLGKYFAQISGNLIGGAAGHAVGGPTGMAIGTIVGGEVGGFLRGKQMAGTFGEPRGLKAKPNTVLEQAAQKAKEGRIVDLRKPDVKVGAAKDIPKTKEILKVERQISENVEAQKKAISKGDYTLVAALKEIYKALVEKLKEIIKAIKETASKSERGFIRLDGGQSNSRGNLNKQYKNTPTANKTIIDGNDSTQLAHFKGFTDITTKVLERLKGKSVTSKQEILDFTNMPELKQAERDLIRNIVNDYKGATVPVKEFANKVKTELLPLKTEPQANYESITLPSKLRGPVADYSERVYTSSISTSAGDVHFSKGNFPNYFAHSRIEDLPGASTPKRLTDRGQGRGLMFPGEDKLPQYQGSTRRVIELQSDLFQKGRLEGEQYKYSSAIDYLPTGLKNEYAKAANREMSLRGVVNKNQYTDEIDSLATRQREIEKIAEKTKTETLTKRGGELSKLEPYRNTWHERVIREEVKQAAKDGKTKLQFPTGETAMKIEGLGESRPWYMGATEVTPADLKVGMKISERRPAYSMDQHEWYVTNVLGDGKFKAMPKDVWDKVKNKEPGYSAPVSINRASETFDISGKVDTNNPIYKFYEKEVGKYITNKYGAKSVTDAQGVTWLEITIPKGAARLPVEAFGILPLLVPNEKE